MCVGHWKNPEVCAEITDWVRAAAGWQETQCLKVARFGDNMRDVAVTEGDKVEAQFRLGYEVSGFGVGDLVERVQAVPESAVEELINCYREEYNVDPTADKKRLSAAARIEAGLRTFLEEGDFKAFTTTFEDLHGLEQLPGIAAQRLMSEGYGFAAEGDWKTAALLRAVKVMGEGLPGGSSFMEDYTYHFDPLGPLVLGAHMLEICPSIMARGDRPSLEIHPLSIGGKDDPVRLVFDGQPGPALNASLVDMGNRFRLIINVVEAIAPPHPMPALPVARVVWKPLPTLKDAAAAWILAGGAHHTAYIQSVPLRVFRELRTHDRYGNSGH